MGPEDTAFLCPGLLVHEQLLCHPGSIRKGPESARIHLRRFKFLDATYGVGGNIWCQFAGSYLLFTPSHASICSSIWREEKGGGGMAQKMGSVNLTV